MLYLFVAFLFLIGVSADCGVQNDSKPTLAIKTSDLTYAGTSDDIYARVRTQTVWSSWAYLHYQDCDVFQKDSTDYFSDFSSITDDWIAVAIHNCGNDALYIDSVSYWNGSATTNNPVDHFCSNVGQPVNKACAQTEITDSNNSQCNDGSSKTYDIFDRFTIQQDDSGCASAVFYTWVVATPYDDQDSPGEPQCTPVPVSQPTRYPFSTLLPTDDPSASPTEGRGTTDEPTVLLTTSAKPSYITAPSSLNPMVSSLPPLIDSTPTAAPVQVVVIDKTTDGNTNTLVAIICGSGGCAFCVCVLFLFQWNRTRKLMALVEKQHQTGIEKHDSTNNCLRSISSAGAGADFQPGGGGGNWSQDQFVMNIGSDDDEKEFEGEREREGVPDTIAPAAGTRPAKKTTDRGLDEMGVAPDEFIVKEDSVDDVQSGVDGE